LHSLLTILVTIFAASSMLAVGFSHKLRDVISPLRDIPGLITAVVANFVLVPLLAVGILRLIPLERPMAVGMILVASAAGAPMLIKLATNAGESAAFAAAILVLLIIVTIAYMPLVVPLLADEEASTSAWAIAKPLVLTMLVPMAVGFLIQRYIPRIARALLPYLGVVINISLWSMVMLVVYLNFGAVIGVFGTGAILAALLLIGGAFAIGYLVGTFDRSERTVLGFATAQRNFAAANVVAIDSFTDSGVLVMAVVISVVALLLIPLSMALGKRRVKDTDIVGVRTPAPKA
jgi:BASS family bile acid:Na+ symporter